MSIMYVCMYVGEWISTKRAASGTEILEEYLKKALSFAVTTSMYVYSYSMYVCMYVCVIEQCNEDEEIIMK